MCPTCMVLTDSHHVPATDTLTGIDCKDTTFFRHCSLYLQFFAGVLNHFLLLITGWRMVKNENSLKNVLL